MSAVFRVAFRLRSLPSFPYGTSHVSRSFDWIPGVVGGVQVVAEWGEDELGTPVPDAIRFTLDVAADDADLAIEIAEQAADTIARILALMAGAPYASPRPVALFDVTPGRESRLYKQWGYDVISTKPSRPLNRYEFELHANSLGARDPRERDAILRAIKWYTDALNERILADRFLKAWVGLECIGGALDVRVHKQNTNSCSTCLGGNDEKKKEEKEERGMRHILSVVAPDSPDIYDRLKQARNKLVHGEWTLERIDQAISQSLDSVLESLLRGILTTMGPPGAEKGIRQAMVPARVPRRGADVSITMDVLSADPNILGALTDRFTLRPEPRDSGETAEGYRMNAGFEIHGEFGAPFVNLQIRSEREDDLVCELTEVPEAVTVEAIRSDGSRWRVPQGHEREPGEWERIEQTP